MTMDKEKTFKNIIIILFIGFLILYTADGLGYYEVLNAKKATLTDTKIKEFEEDIKNNKEIDNKKYLTDIENTYQNNLTNTCSKISNKVTIYFKSSIESIFKVIGKLIED